MGSMLFMVKRALLVPSRSTIPHRLTMKLIKGMKGSEQNFGFQILS